ncbi:uncharacterized protein TNIN_378871 [Trichonephila inaurata madagascariensis]|uniref:Uncharacterized protein n=1 Tax=Trichonephila inaurata madagascariensis TaxID=2747483 RepID=A0A8X6WUH1_9ARAC|nr:uncharacterized protein TNIN_378871 [Trichonephila inaurata madagascariensis]
MATSYNVVLGPLQEMMLIRAECSDSIGALVKDRILCEYDFIASEAKYHTLYYANFLNRLPFTEKKPRQDDQVSEAMAEMFNYIENHDDSQFTLKELREMDHEEERLRIVEAAAAIIREDIWSSVDETKSYPPPTSYGKIVQYEISTAYHPQPRILSSESGALVQYVGDNVNINLHTLDESFPNLNQLAQVFQEENCPVQTLHENGVRVLLAIYNTPQSENSIDNLRYTQFFKSTKLNKPVQLFIIPPTSAVVHQHISRVYYQVQPWLGNHLEHQEWFCGMNSWNRLRQYYRLLQMNYSKQYSVTAKMVVAQAVNGRNWGAMFFSL